MIQPNFMAVGCAALIPMVLGFIYYNPKVLGGVWMRASGMTPEKAKGANMFLVFGLSFVFALMLAISMQPQVIHQMGVFSALYYALKDPARMADAQKVMDLFVADGPYAHEGRTFGHGALHGFLLGLFVLLPAFATNALFERKSFAYVAVNIGYWLLCLSLMGGLIAAWQ